MKCSIDSSLLTKDGQALGRIHGSLAFTAVPAIGSTVSFMHPKEPASPPMVDGFNGLVRVSEVQFAANREFDGVQVLLEDIVVPGRSEGLKLAEFLENGFGLYFDEYQQ